MKSTYLIYLLYDFSIDSLSRLWAGGKFCENQTTGVFLRGRRGKKHLCRRPKAACRAAADLAPDRAFGGRAGRAALPPRQQGHAAHRGGGKSLSAKPAAHGRHATHGGQCPQHRLGRVGHRAHRHHLFHGPLRHALYQKLPQKVSAGRALHSARLSAGPDRRAQLRQSQRAVSALLLRRAERSL